MADPKEKRKTRFWRTIRNGGEYVLFRLVGAMMRALPLDTASGLMGAAWKRVAPRLHRHARALAHLEQAFPEKTVQEREAIAIDMWEGLGRVFAESFMVDRIIAANRIETDAGPLLTTLKLRGTGIVFVSLHTGNFELVIQPTLDAGLKCAGVYQRIRNPLVDDFAVAIRRPRYPRGLFAKGPDVGRRLLRIVRDGGSIAMLADLRDRRGISVPFFGRPAPSTSFPAFVARATNSPLVAARVIRTGGVNFRVEAEVIELPVTDDREADIAAGTAAIQARFESWIRELPAQWMWAHRRWG